MKWIICLLVSCVSLSGQILTNGQTVPWRPGVIGGIPYYPTSITITGAVADGVADDYQAITNAMRRCTNGGAVYLPAGHYRFGTEINFLYPTQVVLRGAGPELTFLESTASGSYHGCINFIYGGNLEHVDASSGYTFGSNQITISSASGFATGQLALIIQLNDPARVFGALDYSYCQGQMFIITNVAGNVITVDRPLYYTYSATYSPLFYKHGSTPSPGWCGLESLTVLQKTNATSKVNPVYFYSANNCWMTNCNVTNGVQTNIEIGRSYAISIVSCRTERHQGYTSSDRYGINMGEWTSDCLIENNIVQGNNASILCIYGACGNVVSYNFCNQGFVHDCVTDPSCPSASDQGGGFGGHGDNANFNLFEGNIYNTGGVDETHGNNYGFLFFRNWPTCFSYFNWSNATAQANQGVWAMDIAATNYYMNVLANICGSPRDSNATSNPKIIVGYSRQNNNDPYGTPWDSNTVRTTSIFHGNFDWNTNGVQWDSRFADHSFSNSYYLASKPGWFSNLAWPAIGPDVNTTATITNNPIIPAQARWFNYNYSSPIAADNTPRQATRLRGIKIKP